MNFRPHWLPAGGGGPSLSIRLVLLRIFGERSPRVPPGNLGGGLLERPRRGEEPRLSRRTAQPHPGSGRPRGAAPGARAKAHSGRRGAQPGLPGLPSPAARSGRGSSSLQPELPPARWLPRSREHRAHGPLEPRPRDREVPELGAALVSLPPGMGVVDTCSHSQSSASGCSYRGLGGRPEPAELPKVPVDPLLPPAHCRRLGWRCERLRGFSVVPAPSPPPVEPPP